jgi:hypothetical protein
VAHIPIERAMDLIVQQNLPVYPKSGAGANTDVAGKDPVGDSAAGKGKSSAQ